MLHNINIINESYMGIDIVLVFSWIGVLLKTFQYEFVTSDELDFREKRISHFSHFAQTKNSQRS